MTETRALGIWDITESLSALEQQLDIKMEDNSHLPLTHEKKRAEWFSTRIMAREMMGYMGWSYHGIFKDQFGKPHFKHTSVQVSVTHSFPFVSVLIDKTKPVGIDMEYPNVKLLKIARRFLSEDELTFIDPNDTKMLAIAWGAKEALYKLHGRRKLSFREQLLLDPYTAENNEGQFSGKIIDENIENYDLKYKIFEKNDYILVFTT
ncbi:MAG: 4'-phosphopantetheinyl transferase superfamily protein [Cyclobacteriaceae bacterium]|nr:4'-phosphopantetheinyl transferase superfamily protein [Cyclobacteriaceae bacterium]